MSLTIGQRCPDFEANTSHGPMRLHAWMADRWTLVFAFKSQSPTCSTEFVAIDAQVKAFARHDIALLGVSLDSTDQIQSWLADLQEDFGCTSSFPWISDTDGAVASTLGLLDHTRDEPTLLRTAFVIAPDKRVSMTQTYPVTNARNFEELLRIARAAQVTAAHRVATGSTWRDGDAVMLPPSLEQREAEARYPSGVKVIRSYLRLIDQPD